MADQELDVRPLHKPAKHPTIFQTYDALAVGESFVLVNNHDPRPLRGEFETEHPGSHGWEYLEKGPEAWRVRISKLASTPLPRVLRGDVNANDDDLAAAGSVWKLQMGQRDLDSNIIQLQPEGTIDAHAGPDLDVLLVILDGSGELGTELDTVPLRPGSLVWLPRRSQRRFTAGHDGLRYITVHQRRQAAGLHNIEPRSAER